MRKAALFSVVLILFTVTAWREVAMFTSFAATKTDYAMGAAFALALVISKLALASQATTLAEAGRRALAVFCGLLVVPLLAISIAGTALYFESAYQHKHKNEQQNSDDYQNKTQLIEQKRNSAQQLKTLAGALTEKGNTWAASVQLKQAAAIERELPELIASLNATTQSTSAATIGGNQLAGWRWAVWAGVAVLADLLQIVGAMLLTLKTKTRNETEQKTEQKTEQNQPEDNWLAAHLADTGCVPSVRAAKAEGVNYASYKNQIQQLLNAGIIQPNASGKGWQPTKN